MEVHDPHSVEGGDQHEKKPVIKKVKDKVKKIKDRIISKKQHGHDHHHDDDYSEEGEGYEYDDDEEKEIDPQVHGAPIYDNAGARNLASSRDENIGHGKMSLGEARVATAAADPWVPKKSAMAANDESQLLYPSPKGTAADGGGNLMTGSIPAAGTEQNHPSFQSPTVYDSVGARNLASSRDENIGHGKMNFGEARASTTVEDACTPKKSAVSDQTQFWYPSPKVTAGDRSGNVMTGSIPATGTEQNHPSCQYPTPAVYESATVRNLTQMSLGEVMASTAVEDPGMPKKSVASYESQMLYPSPEESVGGDKVGMLGAISERVEEDPAAPKAMTGSIPVARMEQNNPSYHSPTGRDEVGESPLLSSFQAMSVSDEPKDRQNITETLPTGTHDQFSPYRAHQDLAGEQKSSTYTDKISSTATAAKDAAVSAAISAYEKVSGAGTTLLGKGTTEEEKYDTGTHNHFSPDRAHQDQAREQKSSTYTDKIASTATAAKDAAVSAAISAYEKVSEAGTGLLGKGATKEEKYDTKSSPTGQPGQPLSDKVSRVGTAIMGKGTVEVEKYDAISGQTGQPGQPMSDNRVSMKEYMAGKLRPGDNDRALSEVITETIYNNKQEAANTSSGRAREGSGEDSGGKGMFDKMKGVVTSWIGAGAHPSETTDTEFKENQQSAYTGTQATQEERMQ